MHQDTRIQNLVFPEDYCPGSSAAMTSLYQEMGGLSRGGLSVLIHGETGVGKEPIARILQASSTRSDARRM